MTKVLRIPLVGSPTQRSLTAGLVNPSSATDQIFGNCFPEVFTNPVTGKSKVWLTKRNGITPNNSVLSASIVNPTFGAVPVSGLSNNGAVFSFSVSGTNIAFYDSSAGTQIGANVSGVDTCPFMESTSISGSTNLTASLGTASSGLANQVWYYPDGGSWTQITDANFPTTGLCETHAHMDGWMFVMTTNGRIYNSNLNTLATWSGNYITVDPSIGLGCGLARYKDYIVAFGQNGAQFLQNAGNPTGSPLKRVAVINTGGFRANGSNAGVAMMTIADTVYWVGRIGGTTPGIFRLNGTAAEKVSNVAVDKMISSLTNILGWGIINGQTHIFFGNGGNPALAYCPQNKCWWSIFLASSANLIAVRPGVNGAVYETQSTAGNKQINAMAPGYIAPWADLSFTFTVTVQTDNMDVGTDRKKYWKRLRLVYDKQTSSSPITVSWSDDDYNTFTSGVTIDMGTGIDSITRLGSSRRRAWKFAHTSATPMRIEAVEIEYDVGLN